MTLRLSRFLLCLLAAVAVGACQSISDKRKIDYKSTRVLPPLDIPPELATPDGVRGSVPGASGAATYSSFVSDEAQKKSQSGSDVLPEYDGIRIERDGQARWLVVKLPAEQLWPRVREFILDRGLIVDKENPQTGILETDWAENRANVGTGIQKVLSKALGSLYSTGTRDKFRFRLERSSTPGTTEIYLSHRSMVETVTRRDSYADTIQTMWEPGPTNPGLEAEMLRLLMVSLGMKEERAKTMVASIGVDTPPERARLERKGNGVSLSLSEDFGRAWRRVGLALDRTSFTVEDRDRSRGIYFVRYIDPDAEQKKKGWLRSLFSGEEKAPSNEFQIVLQGSGAQTRVDVLTKEGVPESSKTGERILTLLHEQLK